MSWTARARSRWRQFFRRQQVEDDLDAEIQDYFAVLVDRYREQGMSEQEARRAARVRYEGSEQVKEKVRAARAGASLEAAWKDVRYACRMVRRNPGFAAVAVCSLAIGIGATSAIYSIADALLLRPLPVPRPGGVVALAPVTDQALPGLNAFSYPDYVDLRDRNRTFEGILAQAYNAFGFASSETTLPRMKFGMFVSGNFFQLLGVDPALGRIFRPDEDQAEGRDAVAVLSHDLWMAEYQGRRSVVGDKAWLNGIELTIVGVAPESFTGTDQFLRPAIYVPFAMWTRLTGAGNLQRRQYRSLALKGRLLPGFGFAQAQSDISRITAWLQRTYPQDDSNLQVKVESELQFQTEFSPPRTAMVGMLGLLALCVLLVACANVAGLLLSRSLGRAREIAVRLAVGAGRGSLVRQLLIENSLLALAGGAAGLWLAYAVVRLWNSVPWPTDLPIKFTLQLDGRVLLFTALVSIASTFLFGLAPALRSTRPNLVSALKAGGGGASRKGRLWGRNLLVGGQVAMSLVLLMVCAVMVEGFRADLVRGPGFRVGRLFLSTFNTSLLRYTDAQRDRFFKQLLDRTRLAPGVQSAALASAVPITVGGASVDVVPEGYALKPGQNAVNVFQSTVTNGYFDTMNIPLVRGRSFAESDRADTVAVAIVNQHFAHHYWPGREPLGRTFHLRNITGPLIQVVGVAKTSKYLSISEAPMDFVYLPLSQHPQPQMTLIVQSQAADPSVLAPVTRRVVEQIDRNMPVFDTRTLSDIYENRAVKTSNMIVQTVGALAVMGLALAVVGLYGLIAFSVSRRTREFGIRMAIGADTAGISRMVMKQGFVLGASGVAVGSAAAFFVCRAITSQMFLTLGSVGPMPGIIVSAGLILTTTAAAWLPARRASRIDPTRALRDE